MFLKSLALRRRLLVLVELLVLFAVGMGALVAAMVIHGEIKDDVRMLLTTVAEMRAKEVELEFDDIKRQLRITAERNMVKHAMDDLVKGVQEIQAQGLDMPDFDVMTRDYGRQLAGMYDNAENEYSHAYDPAWAKLDATGKVLQSWYVFGNSYAINRKFELERADMDVAYNRAHATYHGTFRRVMEEMGYFDVMLVGPDGRVVYTVYKEVDLGTNIRSGAFASTGMAKVAAEALAGKAGQVFFSDMGYYVTSVKDASFFAAIPVFKDGVRLGALVVQVPPTEFNRIASSNELLGDSADVYIMGQDRRLRSQQHGALALAPMGLSETDFATAMGHGGSGWMEGVNGREHKPLYAYVRWLNLPDGLRWAVVARKGEEEVRGRVLDVLGPLAVCFALVWLAAGLLGYAFVSWLVGFLIAENGEGAQMIALENLRARERTAARKAQADNRGDDE